MAQDQGLHVLAQLVHALQTQDYSNILSLIQTYHINDSLNLSCLYIKYDPLGNMQRTSLLCYVVPPALLGGHLAQGSHHTPLILACSRSTLHRSHTSSLYDGFAYHRPPSASHRIHTGRNQDAPRGHGHDSRNTVHTAFTPTNHHQDEHLDTTMTHTRNDD